MLWVSEGYAEERSFLDGLVGPEGEREQVEADRRSEPADVVRRVQQRRGSRLAFVELVVAQDLREEDAAEAHVHHVAHEARQEDEDFLRVVLLFGLEEREQVDDHVFVEDDGLLQHDDQQRGEAEEQQQQVLHEHVEVFVDEGLWVTAVYRVAGTSAAD